MLLKVCSTKVNSAWDLAKNGDSEALFQTYLNENFEVFPMHIQDQPATLEQVPILSKCKGDA
jgi:hypothetical protein